MAIYEREFVGTARENDNDNRQWRRDRLRFSLCEAIDLEWPQNIATQTKTAVPDAVMYLVMSNSPLKTEYLRGHSVTSEVIVVVKHKFKWHIIKEVGWLNNHTLAVSIKLYCSCV